MTVVDSEKSPPKGGPASGVHPMTGSFVTPSVGTTSTREGHVIGVIAPDVTSHSPLATAVPNVYNPTFAV